MALGGCTHSSWIKRNTLCYLTVPQTWLLTFTLLLENCQMLCRVWIWPVLSEVKQNPWACPTRSTYTLSFITSSNVGWVSGRILLQTDWISPMQICHRYKLWSPPPLHSGPQSWWEACGHRFLIFEITAPGNTSSVFQAHFIKQTVTADCQKDYQVSARMTKKSLRVGPQSRTLKALLGLRIIVSKAGVCKVGLKVHL